MKKQKRGKRVVSQDARFVVKILPAAVNDPLSPEQVLADHAEYFGSVAGLADAGLIARARDELAREVREATENEERRGDQDEIIEAIRRH